MRDRDEAVVLAGKERVVAVPLKSGCCVIRSGLHFEDDGRGAGVAGDEINDGGWSVGAIELKAVEEKRIPVNIVRLSVVGADKVRDGEIGIATWADSDGADVYGRGEEDGGLVPGAGSAVDSDLTERDSAGAADAAVLRGGLTDGS